MGIVDERDLREQLAGVLDTFVPPDAPVRAAARQGKLIQAGRSLGIVAGLAVVAGLGVGLPGLLNQPASEVSHARPMVMVVQTCAMSARDRPATELATGGCAWLKP
jgi:hypothetical protein